MENFNVVNYHITNRCNYDCTYCFGKFEGQHDPSIDDAKAVVDNIALYFTENGIANGRINLAGGEPTLYKHLDELIDYIASRGISVSMVTNGSRLCAESIGRWKEKVCCIGLSVDSASDDTNRNIGRCCNERVLSSKELVKIADAIHECGIELKINTVVSKFNINEDLSKVYGAMAPDRIKLFQMHLVKGINDRARDHKITKKEFKSFCKRHNAFRSVIVKEPKKSMENSYLMVNPNGEFQLNDNGNYKTYGNLKDTPLCKILEAVPLLKKRFALRYKKGVRK